MANGGRFDIIYDPIVLALSGGGTVNCGTHLVVPQVAWWSNTRWGGAAAAPTGRCAEEEEEEKEKEKEEEEQSISGLKEDPRSLIEGLKQHLEMAK